MLLLLHVPLHWPDILFMVFCCSPDPLPTPHGHVIACRITAENPDEVRGERGEREGGREGRWEGGEREGREGGEWGGGGGGG